MRIARELYDVVAHSLTLIAVQAGVANHVATRQPQQAAQALSSIETLSRGALTEMRALLGVLRADQYEPAAQRQNAVLQPAPGLADLEHLAEQTAAAGVRVNLDIQGSVPDLRVGLDLAVYRVIQEALTNVVKHAGADRCQVRITSEQGKRVLRCITARPLLPGFRYLPASRGEGQRMTPIRVLVVDDQALLRASFRILLDSEPGLVTVGEAGTGSQAVTLARQEKPDGILMDIRMPMLDGIKATRQITSDPVTTTAKVLILTTFDLDEYVFAALRVIAAGDALLSPGITRRLISEFTSGPEPSSAPPAALTEITDREREVLTLIGLGMSNGEIAAKLFVSMSTVKAHVGRLLAKLGARDRAQLVIAAYSARLVGDR
jgi:DNA-binding NarL/FixJ family response regulator